MKSGVFAVGGQIGSGKTTVAALLGTLIDAPVVSFSGALSALAVSRNLTPSRKVLQRLGAEVVERTPEILCRKILEQGHWTSGGLVLDGLRHTTVSEILRNSVAPTPFWILYVQANFDLRRSRVMAEIGADVLPEWDEQPSEQFLTELRDAADLVLINEDSLSQLNARLVAWLNE